MMLRIAFSIAVSTVIAQASALAFADDGGDLPKKYTPAIRGVLTRGAEPAVTANVCLRQDGSEIRACGYSDFSGHFFIPASGPMHSAPATVGKDGKAVYPKYWLETGRVTSARRLAPIALVDDKKTSIALDCDLARHDVGTPDADACRPGTTALVASDRGSEDVHARGRRTNASSK